MNYILRNCICRCSLCAKYYCNRSLWNIACLNVKIFIYYIYAIRVYKKLAEFKKTATALRATFSIVTTKGTTNMNEQKYCPLSHESGVKCASWCALYDEAGQSCAIMNISTTLDTIADKLDGIDETLYTQEEGR